MRNGDSLRYAGTELGCKDGYGREWITKDLKTFKRPRNAPSLAKRLFTMNNGD